jgi:hypothetical protein
MPNISPIVLKGAIASLDPKFGIPLPPKPHPQAPHLIFRQRFRHELDRAHRNESERDRVSAREVGLCS